jgi:hypothetical protein
MGSAPTPTVSRPIVWHVSISGSRVESESNEPLPTAARRPEFIVNLVLGVRTCRLVAQASESDFEPLRTARAIDLDKRPSIVIRHLSDADYCNFVNI